jgi:hypothetical protein
MKIRGAEQTRASLDYKRKAAVLGPTACVWAAKLAQRNCCPVDAAKTKAQGNRVEPQRVTTLDDDFQVKGEPLYGGKGKRSGLTYNHCDIDPPDTCNHAGGQPSSGTIADPASGENLETTAYAGLDQPRLLSSNSVVLGEAKSQMRRENKQRRQVLRAKQPLISPWTQHQGLMDTITPTDHTACPPHRNPCAQMGERSNTPWPICSRNGPHLGAPHKQASHG